MPDFDSVDGDDLQSEYFEKKKIDKSDIKSAEDAKDLMKDMIKWMLKEKAPKLDKVTRTSEVKLNKVDGKWLISDIDEVDD